MISYFLSHELNYNYNVRVAKVFGLCSAVYLGVMLTEQLKAQSEKKLYKDKYFSCNRDFIYDKTTLGNGKQKEIEENLVDCQVLVMLPFPNNSKKFYYYIDEAKLEYLVVNYKEDEPNLNPETKKVKTLVPVEALPKLTAKQREIQTAMKAVSEPDAELYELISQWVEVLVTKNGYCAQSQLRINLQDLDKYAKGSKQVKVDILRMAVKTGWKDITYCINDYDKELKSNTRNSKENQYQANETKEQKAADMQAVKDKIARNSNVF